MRGRNEPPVEDARGYRFAWHEAQHLPPIGTLTYVPENGGLFQMFGEGRFTGAHLHGFPAVKRAEHLQPANRCVFCGRTHDDTGTPLKLTSEHVIPEFLGAGLELPAATCDDCQKITSFYEGHVATKMFDAVRKAFRLIGKGGELSKTNFPVDIGLAVSEQHMLPAVHHPTILVIPSLYPASVYSNRPCDTDGMFKFAVYNINATQDSLIKYDIDRISTVVVDTVHFLQVVGKIAHVYACGHLGYGSFSPLLTPFIRTSIPVGQPYSSQYNNIGRLWQSRDEPTSNLHEIEIGIINWNGQELIGARVRLFASYGMPSFHVAVGTKVVINP